MKHLLIIVFSAATFIGTAQTTKPTSYVRHRTAAKPSVDSATIYYNLGWDNYKLDSMGPARYYWDLGGNAKGSSASRLASLNRLGLMFQNGQGLDTNYAKAYEYFKRAAYNNGRLGNPDALKSIGGLYENGLGFEKSDTKALEWYLKAKQAGNQYVDDDIKRVRGNLRKN